MNGIIREKRKYGGYPSVNEAYFDYDREIPLHRFIQDPYTAKPQRKQHIDVIQQIVERKPELALELNGKRYALDQKLHHIVEQINEAKEILDYEEGWDGECALPTDNQTFVNAARFVMDYAQVVFENYDELLTTPYIDILKDGSVSVHWESERAQLLIIFKKNNKDLAYYYARKKERKVPFKSAVEPRKPVDDLLVLWMQKNLV